MISIKGRALTPQEAVEAAEHRRNPPPPEVCDAVNELIVANLKNGYARVWHKDLWDLVAIKCEVAPNLAWIWTEEVIATHFRDAGWTTIPVVAGTRNSSPESYYIFALEPVPTNEAIWAKHHPGEPMPLLAHAHDHELRKLTPGNNGWGKDAASDFTWRTEKSRLEYMERVAGWQKMRQETREQVWRKFHPDRPMPRVVFATPEEEDSCGTTERAILSFLESLERTGEMKH